jgi:copper(I)-binding protein
VTTRLPFILLALLGAAACTDPGDPKIDITGAYVVTGAGVAPSAIYATFRNVRAIDDTLLVVIPERAEGVMLHETTTDAEGRSRMTHIEELLVPGRATVSLRPGGAHVMVTRFEESVVRGDSVYVTFRFARAGAISLNVAVIDHSEVDRVTSGGR